MTSYCGDEACGIAIKINAPLILPIYNTKVVCIVLGNVPVPPTNLTRLPERGSHIPAAVRTLIG